MENRLGPTTPMGFNFPALIRGNITRGLFWVSMDSPATTAVTAAAAGVIIPLAAGFLVAVPDDRFPVLRRELG